MRSKMEDPWLEAGYEIFSIGGPDALKVERIARIVGKSKSSFYHHFADLEIFQKKLLERHLKRMHVIAARGKLCKAFVPDYVHLMVEVKQDLLFNQQLRIHRQNLAFQLCFQHSVSIAEDGFIGIWVEMLGLSDEPTIAKNILEVATDLLYHRMTNENFTYDWMLGFLDELKTFLKDVIKSSGVGSQLK